MSAATDGTRFANLEFYGDIDNRVIGLGSGFGADQIASVHSGEMYLNSPSASIRLPSSVHSTSAHSSCPLFSSRNTVTDRGVFLVLDGCRAEPIIDASELLGRRRLIAHQQLLDAVSEVESGREVVRTPDLGVAPHGGIVSRKRVLRGELLDMLAPSLDQLLGLPTVGFVADHHQPPT